IPIIDKLDDLGSDSIANAIDQFNDTILLLSKSIQESDVDKIKEWKILDDLGGKEEGNFAEFLQRNLNIEATLKSTETFERWYYELTGIPNLNDEKFNVKSGIAIAYALTNFENLVTTMEIYFTKSLQYRLKLIVNALRFFGYISEDVEATLDWTRNLPFDLREKTEVAAILKKEGLLSDETILKLFPKTLIANPVEEIKKRAEEKKQAFQDNQDAVESMIKEPKLKEEDDE
ncbi:MAG: phage portal protein, partial [Gammaproteobacteria bacterium]|nr:phage portal protein [Gammaproteobacteria bacterium]